MHIPSIDLTTPSADGHITYEDLLTKYSTLQWAHNTLQADVRKLNAQNEHWIKVFTHVEKGMSIKLHELDTVKLENSDLKVLCPLSWLMVDSEYSAIKGNPAMSG